jgi:hypothetical protein
VIKQIVSRETLRYVKAEKKDKIADFGELRCYRKNPFDSASGAPAFPVSPLRWSLAEDIAGMELVEQRPAKHKVDLKGGVDD